VQTDRHEGITLRDHHQVGSDISIYLARKGSGPRSTEFEANSEQDQ
jgi:hypothetical protein